MRRLLFVLAFLGLCFGILPKFQGRARAAHEVAGASIPSEQSVPTRSREEREVAPDSELVEREDSAPAPAAHRCDGRTRCPQMRSCEEAKWFLQHCPGTQMDGDADGNPCEQQWCGR
jgi:hypothetical protein